MPVQYEQITGPTPTNTEQEILELINRARLDPAGEFNKLVLSTNPVMGVTADVTNALNFFHVDLNLFEQQLQNRTSVAPLAWNSALASTATQQSAMMIQFDTQSHQLPGEADLGARLQANGYSFSLAAENIFAYATDALDAHGAFVVDWGNTSTGMQDPPTHRNTVLSANFTEVGIDATQQLDTTKTVGPLVVTQDFGSTFNYSAQVVGVVFRDANGDNFYNAGEGLGGVTVTLTGTGGTFTTTTWSSGGYQLAAPSGTYTETFSGGGLHSVKSEQVTITSSNVKVDDNDALTSPTASLSAVTDTGGTHANAGHQITITITTSESVTVTGTPTLQLNDNEVATYTNGSGTNTLTFTYMVQSGDVAADLQVTGLNLPAGTSIHDAAGNNLSGPVAGDLGLMINMATFTGDAMSQIETIYIGYFGRAGDPSGTNYWTNQLLTGGSTVQTMTGIAASYSVQPESQAQYPFLANPLGATTSGAGNQLDQFINSVYQNLFGRAADGTDTSGGLSYWRGQILNVLATHDSTALANELGSFILQVAYGAQNTAAGQDQTVLANKVTVADVLTQTFSANNIHFGNDGSAADQFAHTDVASVTASAVSVTAAEVAIVGIIHSLV